MRNIKSLFAVAASIGLLVGSCPSARAELKFTSGFDYSSGKYGGTESTDILYIPLTIKNEGVSSLFRLTVPLLTIRGPSGGDIIGIGPDGQPIRAGNGPRETESGLGDVIAAYTYYAYESAATGTYIDLTGKVKFGTADETKDLGTGENDYSAQIDFYKTVGNLTWLLTGGYRVYGDPPGVDFDNAFYGSVGGVVKRSRETSIGIIYDFREKIQPTSDPLSELTVYISSKSGKGARFQWYALTGFSDASPDWGIGFTFTVGF